MEARIKILTSDSGDKCHMAAGIEWLSGVAVFPWYRADAILMQISSGERLPD